MTAAGSPHSETLGSKPARRLPEAYRCPPRLSSVPSAKASTIRPCRQPHTRGTRKTKRTPDDRSSTLCDHKTIKQTTRPPTKGTRSKYISTSRPRPATPQGRPRGPLASTLQFSNHHATPHTPTRNTREGTHGGHPNANPHTRRPWRPGNPTACPYPPPQGGATILPRQHARHPRGRPPRHHARQTIRFSVERR